MLLKDKDEKKNVKNVAAPDKLDTKVKKKKKKMLNNSQR